MRRTTVNGTAGSQRGTTLKRKSNPDAEQQIVASVSCWRVFAASCGGVFACEYVTAEHLQTIVRLNISQRWPGGLVHSVILQRRNISQRCGARVRAEGTHTRGVQAPRPDMASGGHGGLVALCARTKIRNGRTRAQ